MKLTTEKLISDELYIDSFTKNNTMTLDYDGPEIIYVLVDNNFNQVQTILESPDDQYNKDFSYVVVVNANQDPDVAYWIMNDAYEERQFVTETLVDGSTYEQITNPVLRDYYTISYDKENSKWMWELILREKKSILNQTVEKYRNFIQENMSKIEEDETSKKIAEDYLKKLTDFETNGKGSIPSWKMIDAKLSDVPTIPNDLFLAFNATL